jgi:hypothetical protein
MSGLPKSGQGSATCENTPWHIGVSPASAAEGGSQVQPEAVGQPWLWTLVFGQHEARTPTHSYAATREAAMAAFAKVGGGNEGISAFGHPGNAADR